MCQLMKKHYKSLMAGTFAALTLASGNLFADTGSASVDSATPKPLVVVSNGTEYTQVSGTSELSINGRLNYDTGTAGRVKSWEVWPQLQTGFSIQQDVPNTKYWGKQSQSYGVGNRPKKINANVTMKLTMALVSDYALSMCNMQASVLRGQGLSNTQIFGQDRSVHFWVSAGYKVDATGAGSNKAIWEYSPPYKLPVTCSRHVGTSLPKPGAAINHTPKPPPAHTQKLQAPTLPQPPTRNSTLQTPNTSAQPEPARNIAPAAPTKPGHNPGARRMESDRAQPGSR